MKKTLFLLLIMAITFSCSRSNDSNEENVPPLKTKVLSKIMFSDGSQYIFNYQNKKLNSISLGGNPFVTFEYSNENLSKVIYYKGSKTFTYNNGKIEKIFLNGKENATLSYDTSQKISGVSLDIGNLTPENLSITYDGKKVVTVDSYWSSKSGYYNTDTIINPYSTIDKNILHSYFLCQGEIFTDYIYNQNNYVEFLNQSGTSTKKYSFVADSENYAIQKKNTSGSVLESYEYIVL